jgi:hypothetical protein
MRWNPLDMNESMNVMIINQSKKQQIRNILKSYVGFFDPFCELIQNAMDAVDMRKKQVVEDDYKRQVKIVINLQNNTLYVADNGIGFTDEQFKTFLSPNITFKHGVKVRGNKGVGATYLGYGFNRLETYTHTPTYKNGVVLEHARDWVEDTDDSQQAPFAEENDSLEKDFPFSRGSAFRITFGGYATRPTSLSWLNIKIAEQWKYVLLSKTPLGHVFEDKEDAILFDLIVYDNSGAETFVKNQKAIYAYPHQYFDQGVANIPEILEYQKHRLARGLDSSKLPIKYSQLTGYF